ncbi:hypothetical protein AVEN_232724-1 [Araneus ventricosus]|uniref:Uncharacterized protein n=1 Tax=Araneus ventricosus TaxID=182803 RepID=A0A4Y2HGS1_ARAVE|nr:hypothetical protein AVEN_232724-1 [Araneus ventricosus]
MARVFVGWLQHSGETSVNDRKVKRSGLDRDLERVIAYASWVGIRPPAVRIMTAISPQRRLWNAETRTFGTGLFYLFVLEKLTIEKEFFIFFSLPDFLGAQIVFCLRGPTCHRASWQPRQSATEDSNTRTSLFGNGTS